MGHRPKHMDVSSSEDRGIPKAKGKRGGRRSASRNAKKGGAKTGKRKSDRKKGSERPPCRSDNFTYLDEVLTSETSCKSDKEGKGTPPVASPPVMSPPELDPSPPTPSPGEMKPKSPSPPTKKYVSLLDDEFVIENLSGETSSRRSPQSTNESAIEEACSCKCNCKDCRKIREKNTKIKMETKDDLEIDEDQPSEILTRVDKGKISPMSPVDPIDGEGIKMTSSSKILDRFYSPNIFHLDTVLSKMNAGDFRLYPVEGDVSLAKLRRHRQKFKFAIYYKTFHGRYRRYSITEAYIGQEVYYFLDCIDTEAPLFSCLYKLLKYYVDNRTYYSLLVQGFVRFPVGQVMKKGRFERHYCDMLKVKKH